ncbi:hypothetical protein L596_003031 [Steinernema carpocapsae]|uniref:Organic solute transporter alpha-like protein n=1 Tax=Steinernema carpocapsae TaxID=34508 RepID=A0A4U8URY1_STECR|nr:hypothetical protein L596_003031 [Steinernema carpocapsae]
MVVDDILRLFFDSFLNCTNGQALIPPASVYLQELSTTFSVTIVAASLLCFTTISLAVLHVIYIHTYVTDTYRRGFVLFLAGTSPFVSMLSLTSMFIPRTWFLSHLLGFLYFSMALWVIICLLMHIVDGRHSVVKKMAESSARITVQTPPFCCCLPCLPKLEMETKKIRFCEFMVLQSPCVRLVATIISLILYFEYQSGAFFALKLLDFVALPSLLIGIYGTHILVTTVSKLVGALVLVKDSIVVIQNLIHCLKTTFSNRVFLGTK